MLFLAGCGGDEGIVVVFPGSSVGAEAEVLRLQLDRFREERPDVRVVARETPDAADQRHQLYVQWLNAGASEPDILQLDVIWTPEFAAAGWILPLSRFAPDTTDWFAASIAANCWEGELYALPWFVDVGMLYRRTDLVAAAPASLDDLAMQARRATREGGAPHGLVWPVARYEGLVCVFLEILGGFGGRILGADGRPGIDSPAAVAALEFMIDAMGEDGFVPRTALTWHEEETRFAFQNGDAAFMRNWPYAYPLLGDSSRSRVAGKFAVGPMPAAAGGRPTAALGGSQLAINANTKHPEGAWAVIEYLARPEQMLERARIAGQYPPRPSLYDEPALAEALPVPPADARRIIERAVPRPVTPLYTELSSVLQVWLHRALAGQTAPGEALAAAAREMTERMERSAR